MSMSIDRIAAMKRFLLEFRDTVIDDRQAESIARHYIELAPDPLVNEMIKDLEVRRREYAAHLAQIRNKNSENVALQNRLRAAFVTISTLKRERRG